MSNELNKRHIFIVAIDTERRLSSEVVRTYLGMAIKHYHKHDNYDSLGGAEAPMFRVKSICQNEGETEALRDIIMELKTVKDFMNELEDIVDKK